MASHNETVTIEAADNSQARRYNQKVKLHNVKSNSIFIKKSKKYRHNPTCNEHRLTTPRLNSISPCRLVPTASHLTIHPSIQNHQ
ncbi:hypothetical protein FOFC_04117 [Fusarium oxysporum]|nr:hypothetical protein FOFC_04117 [Fusarium oxysporum]